jgi:hypothetical protein
MKKITIFLTFTLLILGYCASVYAQGPASMTSLGGSPTSGQVSCLNTATVLYSTTQQGGSQPYGRLSITFQNQSTVPVYIAPRADISTSNAGVLLITQGHAFTLDRSSGNVTWYCVTASSTATVGWTEEK